MKHLTGGLRPLSWLGLATAVALAAGCSSGPAATTSASRSLVRPTVTSTMDGRTVLPQRFRWQAYTSTPAMRVAKVDFLIDGQLAWEETKAPYVYGRDGNWLVTSFLTPGPHRFTVQVIGTDGHRGARTVQASVTAAAAPPAALAKTWTRIVTPADVKKSTTSEPPPTGRWRLRISSVGWHLYDPMGGGQVFDVKPEPGARLQMRPTIEYPPYPNPNGGGFCADTDPLWTWTWSVASHGRTLTLRPAGHDPCGDRVAILAGTWTQVK